MATIAMVQLYPFQQLETLKLFNMVQGLKKYHFNFEIKMNCYFNILVYPRNGHFDENSKRKNSINQEKKQKDGDKTQVFVVKLI